MTDKTARKVAEFTAETVEKAIEVGLRTLNVSREDVEINVVQREQRKLGFLKSEAVVRIAYDEEYVRRKHDEAQIEKYLTLRYAPDGFALKVDKVPEELHWQLLEVATHFLIRNHVPGFNRVTRDQLVESTSGEWYTIYEPEVIEIDQQRASLYLSPSKMHAYYIQYDVGSITRQSLDDAIEHRGIKHGLINEAIQSIVDGTYSVGLPIVIAQGEPAQNELAAPHEYCFDPGGIRISFKEDASIDFRNITSLSYVKKDDILISVGERRPGQKGCTVTGDEIPFVVEADKPLPTGQSTYITPDSKELRAAIDGHIEMHDGLVCIEEVYQVDGDLDYRVGNLNFDGSIIIAGDVLPEFEIRAKGNVEVFGTVDNAIIESGGDVIVQFGIFSKGFGRIAAKGDVRAKHCENVSIEARRIYIASSAINCQLNAEKVVQVSGNPGTLVGGWARAEQYVFANVFGSELGTRTDVIVGDPSEYDAAIDELRCRIGKNARIRLDLMRKYELAATSKAAAHLTDAQKQRLKLMLQEAERLDKELPVLREELRPIKEKRRRLATAKCHVYTRLHDSVLVKLFNAKRYFSDAIEHCTLLYDKEQIKAFPFQNSEIDDTSAPAPSLHKNAQNEAGASSAAHATAS